MLLLLLLLLLLIGGTITFKLELLGVDAESPAVWPIQTATSVNAGGEIHFPSLGEHHTIH
jgi:hypothetical protein